MHLPKIFITTFSFGWIIGYLNYSRCFHKLLGLNQYNINNDSFIFERKIYSIVCGLYSYSIIMLCKEVFNI